MIDVFKLRQARERKALSQRDLSKISGVAQATIAQLERGERSARPTTLRKLSQALGVEPSALLPETTAPEDRKIHSLMLRSSGSKQVVSIRDSRGVIHQFGSVVEAYIAGWDVTYNLFEGLFRAAHTNVADRYDLIRSKLNSDDPEQVEEAASLALFIANNIARTLDEDSRTQMETVEKAYEALPSFYFKHTPSLMRMVKLWKDVAALQLEAQQNGAKAIQELIQLHGEAVHKLSTIETNVQRERRTRD